MMRRLLALVATFAVLGVVLPVAAPLVVTAGRPSGSAHAYDSALDSVSTRSLVEGASADNSTRSATRQSALVGPVPSLVALVVAAEGGSMELPASETWGRGDTLADHFARQGADFGAATEEEYAQQASEFF